MATGTVPITPGSGQNIAVDTNAGLAGGAAVQLFSSVNSDGSRQPFDPDGTPQISGDATSLLLDDFSGTITTLETVNSGNGGTTPSNSNGSVSPNAGTASAGYAIVQSRYAHVLRAGAYLRIAFILQLESATTTNNTRYWGYGNVGVPSATVSVSTGAAFSIDGSTGVLQAALFNGGTKTVVAALTKPTDNAFHRYELWYRQSIIYWLIDGVIVASRSYPNLLVATNLYSIFGSVNTAAIGSAPAWVVSSVSVSDTSATNRTLSDGYNPSIQATVKQGSTAAAATDQPLVVAPHPSTPTPAGTNLIGAVRVNSTNMATFAVVTTASTNASVIKSSSGQLLELTLCNVTSTVMYVKLYNLAAAPSVGSSVPIMTFRLPATGSAGDFQVLSFGTNGKHFSTGIAIAVTGAATATDASATVAGCQISGTYT